MPGPYNSEGQFDVTVSSKVRILLGVGSTLLSREIGPKNQSAKRCSAADPRKGGHIHRLELLAYLSSWDPGNFWNYLAPSLAVFWPSACITAVLEDTERERTFAASLPPGYRVCYTKRFSDVSWSRKRMQLLKFYADECTSAEYIGFVDSDTLFTTQVTENLLFELDRPRIIAEIGRPRQFAFEKAMLATVAFLNKPEELSCMSYFPQVYWRKHMSSFRAYIEELHNGSFKQIAADLYPSSGTFVEFSVLCNYVLHEHFTSYSFHAQETTAGWRGPLLLGQANVTIALARLERSPVVRAAIHGGYMGICMPGIPQLMVTKCTEESALRCPWFLVVAAKIIQGFCRSVVARGSREGQPSDICANYDKTILQWDLFRFECILDFDWARSGRRMKGCIEAEVAHYRDVSQSSSSLSWRTLRTLMRLAGLSPQQLPTGEELESLETVRKIARNGPLYIRFQ